MATGALKPTTPAPQAAVSWHRQYVFSWYFIQGLWHWIVNTAYLKLPGTAKSASTAMREMNVHLIDNTRISATLGLYFHIKYSQAVMLRKILTIVAKRRFNEIWHDLGLVPHVPTLPNAKWTSTCQALSLSGCGTTNQTVQVTKKIPFGFYVCTHCS